MDLFWKMDLAAEKESFERHGLPFILTQPSPLGLFSGFRKALTGAVTEISETWLNVRPGSLNWLEPVARLEGLQHIAIGCPECHV